MLYVQALAEAFLPVAGPSLGVHYGHDPHVVGLLQIDDGVGELGREARRAGGWKRKKRCGWAQMS
jgi:hypothetical protein